MTKYSGLPTTAYLQLLNKPLRKLSGLDWFIKHWRHLSRISYGEFGLVLAETHDGGLWWAQFNTRDQFLAWISGRDPLKLGAVPRYSCQDVWVEWVSRQLKELEEKAHGYVVKYPDSTTTDLAVWLHNQLPEHVRMRISLPRCHDIAAKLKIKDTDFPVSLENMRQRDALLMESWEGHAQPAYITGLRDPQTLKHRSRLQSAFQLLEEGEVNRVLSLISGPKCAVATNEHVSSPYRRALWMFVVDRAYPDLARRWRASIGEE